MLSGFTLNLSTKASLFPFLKANSKYRLTNFSVTLDLSLYTFLLAFATNRGVMNLKIF